MLYGEWRPQGFAEVVGQEHIVSTLRNALASGKTAHAYLFSGPRGTGKTTTARILARALNCPNVEAGEPCNRCRSCKAMHEGTAFDLIEMDAASNRGIDDVRELRGKIAFAPSDLGKKIYLLDEVHMLSAGAFNALLKTLEEPPPHAVFILATTEAHKVPATILSRCQRYDFRRVPNDAIVGRLGVICEGEGFEVPPEGLKVIAVQSRGGMRDAITLLEQVVAQNGSTVSTEQVIESLGLVRDPRSDLLARAILAADLATALGIARSVADDGLDMARFTRASVDLLREALYQSLAVGEADGDSSELAELASSAGVTKLTSAIAELASADFRLDPASPIPLEVACAAAILVPAEPAAPAGLSEGARRGASPGREAASVLPAGDLKDQTDDGPTPEDKFLRILSERCRLVSVQAGALLNGQCEVVSLDQEEVVLGFYLPVLKSKVETFLPLVTDKAIEILERPVTVNLAMIEKVTPRKGPRGGHLSEAAKALGATPVGGLPDSGEEQRA